MTDPDDAFLRYGFAKPRADSRLRSSPPDRFLPVNFAFRLRDLLGMSARAEIVRFLVTSRARDATVLTVAEAASYAKRNVAEALGQLARSDFVTAFWIGNQPPRGARKRNVSALDILRSRSHIVKLWLERCGGTGSQGPDRSRFRRRCATAGARRPSRSRTRATGSCSARFPTTRLPRCEARLQISALT